MEQRVDGRARRAERPRVEVHESRYGRELVVDGTFASLYRPGRATTGSVWDAIAAPVLALPPERRRRFLFLGLAAGSAARVVRAIAPRAELIGVEIDREVLRVARAHFDLDALRVEVLRDDALAVLERERRRFDAILDDVFVGRGDAVHKPAWIPHPAHDLARARLASGGVLVANTLDEASRVAASLGASFPRVVSIEIEGFDNRVLVGGPRPLSARVLRAAIARSDVLRETLRELRLRTLAR
ncbi:MAG: fused MFS/spermidine synthase [Myxococcales bacterium]|nr:fused MFS/spermidine synthase [Myxococcales bacterium]